MNDIDMSEHRDFRKTRRLKAKHLRTKGPFVKEDSDSTYKSMPCRYSLSVQKSRMMQDLRRAHRLDECDASKRPGSSCSRQKRLSAEGRSCHFERSASRDGGRVVHEDPESPRRSIDHLILARRQGMPPQ